MKLLGDMDIAVYYFREQQYATALNMVAHSIDQIKFIIEAIITDRDYFNLVDTESMLEMFTGILESKRNKDFILLADLLELQLINFIIGVQELIISKEEIIFNEDNYKENILLLLERGVGFPEELKEPINTVKLLENGYRVEFTSSGRMTLAAENEGAKFYFHTNSRIKAEAFLLARHWYQKDAKGYIIYGFGMGYHIEELLAMDNEAYIEIYEADQSVIQLACAFTQVKNLLQNQRIKLIYDPTLELIKNRITSKDENVTFQVHYPSYKNIRSREGKEILETLLPWSKTIEDC
jgi:hypothetical protein